MNGAGVKGGAFGFKVSSINKVKQLDRFHRLILYFLTNRFPSLLIPSL
jgi:hypothetical protein